MLSTSQASPLRKLWGVLLFRFNHLNIYGCHIYNSAYFIFNVTISLKQFQLFSALLNFIFYIKCKNIFSNHVISSVCIHKTNYRNAMSVIQYHFLNFKLIILRNLWKSYVLLMCVLICCISCHFIVAFIINNEATYGHLAEK